MQSFHKNLSRVNTHRRMALNKKEQFHESSQALAAMAKALAHPARVEILQLLAERQSCVCGDIVLELPLAQATVSQHLRELKNAGLVRGEIDGPRVCYCVDHQGLAQLKQYFQQIIDLIDRHEQTSQCCS